MNEKIIAQFTQINAMASLVGHSSAATEGACHNITIEWLSLMLKDNSISDLDAQKRMQALAKKHGAGNAILQKAYVDRWKEGGYSYQVADRMMIFLRGMKEVALAMDYSAYNQTTVMQKLKNPEAPGMVFSFWFPGAVSGAGSGAHTIGFFRNVKGQGGKLVPADEYISAFDPNFGEFYFPAIELGYWLSKLKMVYAGTFTHQMLKYVGPK